MHGLMLQFIAALASLHSYLVDGAESTFSKLIFLREILCSLDYIDEIQWKQRKRLRFLLLLSM